MYRNLEMCVLPKQRLLCLNLFFSNKFHYSALIILTISVSESIYQDYSGATSSFRSKIWINKHLLFCRMENRKLSSSLIFSYVFLLKSQCKQITAVIDILKIIGKIFSLTYLHVNCKVQYLIKDEMFLFPVSSGLIQTLIFLCKYDQIS